MKYYHIEVSETGRYAFVPAEYGRYIRTHVCVLFVDCPAKLCRAKRNNPCISLTKLAKFDTRCPQVQICAGRMTAYKKWQNAQPKTDAGGKIIKMTGRRRARG